MKSSTLFLQWIPRIICILAIIFIGLFATEAFVPGHSLKQQLTEFGMQLLPCLILLGILILSWKRELVGGIFFLIAGIVATYFIFSGNYRHNHSVGKSMGVVFTTTIPFIIAGVLFMISYFLKRKYTPDKAIEG